MLSDSSAARWQEKKPHANDMAVLFSNRNVMIAYLFHQQVALRNPIVLLSST